MSDNKLLQAAALHFKEEGTEFYLSKNEQQVLIIPPDKKYKVLAYEGGPTDRLEDDLLVHVGLAIKPTGETIPDAPEDNAQPRLQ